MMSDLYLIICIIGYEKVLDHDYTPDIVAGIYRGSKTQIISMLMNKF
jgi:hypothetical protein